MPRLQQYTFPYSTLAKVNKSLASLRHITNTYKFFHVFLHVCPELPLFPTTFPTHLQVFPRFLVCVSPIKPNTAPERHRHTSFRRISCMCVLNYPRFRPFSPHTHKFSPDFLYDGRLITPFLAFSATHPRVFRRFLACVPQSHAVTSTQPP